MATGVLWVSRAAMAKPVAHISAVPEDIHDDNRRNVGRRTSRIMAGHDAQTR